MHTSCISLVSTQCSDGTLTEWFAVLSRQRLLLATVKEPQEWGWLLSLFGDELLGGEVSGDARQCGRDLIRKPEALFGTTVVGVWPNMSGSSSRSVEVQAASCSRWPATGTFTCAASF